MPRKTKPKVFTYNDLSKEELSLLEHAPTETTWICKHVYEDDNGVKSRYEMINAGSTSQCVYCRKPKPKAPKLLWPIYVEACKKVGIDPGSTSWVKVSARTGRIIDHDKGKWVEKDIDE